MNRMYDTDNTSLSPAGVMLVLAGLVIISVAPPIGFAMLIMAARSQCKFRREIRDDREHRIARARAKLDREKILAARALGR